MTFRFPATGRSARAGCLIGWASLFLTVLIGRSAQEITDLRYDPIGCELCRGVFVLHVAYGWYLTGLLVVVVDLLRPKTVTQGLWLAAAGAVYPATILILASDQLLGSTLASGVGNILLLLASAVQALVVTPLYVLYLTWLTARTARRGQRQKGQHSAVPSE